MIKKSSLANKMNFPELLDMKTNRPEEWKQFLDMDHELSLNLEKAKAAVAPKTHDIRRALYVGLGIVGASTLAEAIYKYFNKQLKIYKSKEYFQKMLEAHPQLQKEDPIEVARYWESLYHFAPNMAEDPLAAGAYITQSLKRLSGAELGGPPPDTFATLVDIQKKSKEGKQQPEDLGLKARQEAVSQIVKMYY